MILEFSQLGFIGKKSDRFIYFKITVTLRILFFHLTKIISFFLWKWIAFKEIY